MLGWFRVWVYREAAIKWFLFRSFSNHLGSVVLSAGVVCWVREWRLLEVVLVWSLKMMIIHVIIISRLLPTLYLIVLLNDHCLLILRASLASNLVMIHWVTIRGSWWIPWHSAWSEYFQYLLVTSHIVVDILYLQILFLHSPITMDLSVIYSRRIKWLDTKRALLSYYETNAIILWIREAYIEIENITINSFICI